MTSKFLNRIVRPFVPTQGPLMRGAQRRRQRVIGSTQASEGLESRVLLAGVVVSNAIDVTNGDTSSIANLIASDGGDGISLREAIDAANNTAGADSITFDASLSGMTIGLGPSGQGTTLLISDSLDIDASGLASPVTIDGEGDITPFTINSSGNGAIVVLESLTITDGYASVGSNGGNIHVADSTDTLYLRNSNVNEGLATYGGGLNNVGGTVYITDSVISNNDGGYHGAGIYNSGTLTVQNSTFSGNVSVSSGGAIFNTGNLTVTDSVLDSNTVTGDEYGGGIYNGSGGTVVITNSTVSNNVVGDEGGGIYNVGSMQILNSTISGNVGELVDGDAGGGGIYNRGTLDITNTTISGNQAGGGGGGIYNSTGNLTITNSTIFGNSASHSGNFEGGGGGIRNSFGQVSIYNSIVIGNDEMAADNREDISGSVDSSGFNIFGDLTGSTINVVGAGTDITGVNAIDVIEQTLADNGGPTLTHALVEGSLAINAGNNGDATDAGNNPLTTDQRGMGFDRILGSAVDIGAVESGVIPMSFVDANNDGVFNEGDVLLGEELADGIFDTRRTEGNYTEVIHGAGVVIQSTIDASFIQIKADGDIIVESNLIADNDITLKSKHGSIIVDDSAVDSIDGSVNLRAKEDIAVFDGIIFAGESVKLKAKRDVYLLADVIGQDIKVDAKGWVVGFDSVFDAYNGDLKISGTEGVELSGAELFAFDNIKVKSKGPVIAEDSFWSAIETPESSVKVAAKSDVVLDGSWVEASEKVSIAADGDLFTEEAVLQAEGFSSTVKVASRNGNASVYNSAIRASEKISLKAFFNLDLTDASIGITDGSINGRISVKAGNIDLDNVELVAPNGISVRGSIFGIPGFVDDDGTLPLV
ncbi:right-handed parallel beta-helix repeat-containing protein [Thalassoglobus sp. JC818]|uniref:right-handed parallel beta-helix repeat-containing protein n=1 Tax=Thalassoglobus sp. JC818 TaxID=3232136 RepID=UPI00345A6CCD